MERKLASIQIIKNVQPIENAENIERVDILGWHLVAKKGEFKIGDKCIYCEVDSILPERPEFEFLRNKNFRIKTVNLRGQVSQGICFPLSIIAQDNLEEGQDVTSIVGIEKYEALIPCAMQGKIKSNFPSYITKTDETRIQTVPKVLERHKNFLFYVTEKVDGCSITAYIKDGEFSVASRRLVYLDTPDNIWWQMAHKLKLEYKLKSLNMNIAIQGELLGNVQGNKYKLKENRVLWFNVFDITEQKFLDLFDFNNLISYLGLETVPLLQFDFILDKNIDELVECSKGISNIYNIPREGIVLRSMKETWDEELGRLSFKVINPDFLLKFD